MKKITTFVTALAIASSSLSGASKTANDTKIFEGKKDVEFTMQADIAVGDFDWIGAITVNSKGYLVVAGNQKAKVYSPKGEKVADFSTTGIANSCCTDSKGNIYIGTYATKTTVAEILKYSPKGKFIKKWTAIDNGNIKTATGMNCHENILYVADTRDRCINKFDFDGKYLGVVGKRGSEFATCCRILDFGINPSDGSIYVANLGRHKVSYTKNGKSFKDWGKRGKETEDFCGCCNPTNLTVTQSGYIVTAEKTIPRIKVYDKKGKMLAIMGTDIFDRSCGNLDIAVDTKCNIYAIDSKKKCIRKFSPKMSKK